MNFASSARRPSLKYIVSATALFLAAAFTAPNANAGIQYSLEQAQAAPGETVTIRAVLFNDTDSGLEWTPPSNLVLQWRGNDGTAFRSLASLSAGDGKVSVPVNNFVTF